MPSDFAKNLAKKYALVSKDEVSEAPEGADINTLIPEYAAKHGIPEPLAFALVQQESGGNPNAVSPVGAQGLTQLMPATAKSLGVTDPFNVRQNLDAGFKYLKQQHDRFGDWKLATAAYNAGPGNVEKHGGVPPFKETQNYVKSLSKAFGNPKAPPAPSELAQRLSDKYSGKGPDLPSAPVLPSVEPQKAEADNPLFGMLQAFSSGVGQTTGYNKFVQPALQSMTDPITQRLLGDRANVEDIRKNQAKDLQKAEADNPGSKLAGELTGIIAGTGKAQAPVKAVSLLGKVGKLLTTGGLQAGSNEALSNKDATVGSTLAAASIGAPTNLVFNGALAGIKEVGNGFGKLVANIATKTGDSDVGKYVIDTFGPTISKASLKVKNNKIMQETSDKLNSLLSSGDNAKKTVDMTQVVRSPKLLSKIESLDNADERAQAGKLLTKLSAFEKRGKLSLGEANKLKQDLYKQANFNRSSDKYNLSEFQKDLSGELRALIERQGGSEIRSLNQKWANGIKLNEGLSSKLGLTDKLRAYTEVGAAVGSAGGALPTIAAERLLTSIPAATLLGTAGRVATSASDTISPSIAALLSTLIPQMMLKKNEKK